MPDSVIGGDGIDAVPTADDVTLNVDLAGGDDGLEFKNTKLSASTATETVLGSVKIGDNVNVEADGEISVNLAVVTSEITPTDVEVNFLWFDSTSGFCTSGINAKR